MSLKDSLLSGPKAIERGPKCGVTLLLRSLSDEDREVFQAALDDEKWTAIGLSNILRSEGYRVGPQALSRHRRNVCNCAAVL